MNLSIINVIPPNVPSSRKNKFNFEQNEITYIEKKTSIQPQMQNSADKSNSKLDMKI